MLFTQKTFGFNRLLLVIFSLSLTSPIRLATQGQFRDQKVNSQVEDFSGNSHPSETNDALNQSAKKDSAAVKSKNSKQETSLPEIERLEQLLQRSTNLRENHHFSEALSTGHEILKAAEAGNFHLLHARTLTHLSACYQYAGLYEKSEAYREQYFEAVQRHGLEEELIRSYSSLGYSYIGKQDYPASRDAFRQIIDFAQQTGQEEAIILAKCGILNAYTNREVIWDKVTKFAYVLQP